MEIDQKACLNIQKLRRLKGFSQEYMATQLDISTKSYSKLENNETMLTLKKLNNITEVLEISLEKVLGFDESQIFNNCTQDGNIGINHNNYYLKELKEVTDKLLTEKDKTIQLLEEKIAAIKG